MAYLTDADKIKYLEQNKYFGQIKYSRLKDDIKIIKKTQIAKNILFKCITYILEEFESEDNIYSFIKTLIKKSNIDGEFERYIKSKNITQEKDFIEVYNSISIFLEQRYIKATKANASTFFIQDLDIDNEAIEYEYLKRAISQLAFIREESLNATTIEEFIKLLDEPDGSVPEIFRQYNLNDRLILNDESDDLIGLDDFTNSLEIPDFIDNKILNNGILQKSIFLEGVSASGKTILAQSIGYSVSKNNSYYVDFAEVSTNNFDINKNSMDINLFIKSLEDYGGVLILDNIHHSNITKKATRDLIEISNKFNLKIILISELKLNPKQNKDKTFFDNFFNKKDDIEIKESMNYIQISNKNNLYKTRLSIINNFLLYYQNKNIISNETIDLLSINEIEKEFGCSLFYLKSAIEYTQNINDISMNIARQYLKKKYKKFLNLKKNNKIKFLLCYYSIKNISFRIDKNCYKKTYKDEEDFIEYIIEKNLVNKIEYDNYFILSFPHNSIALFILNELVETKNIDITKTIYKYSKYLYLLDKQALIPLIDYKIATHDAKYLKFILESKVAITDLFTLQRLIKALAVLNLANLSVEFNDDINKIIKPSNENIKNLSFEKFMNVLISAERSQYTTAFVDDYISNKEIVFKNIDFTVQIINYYKKTNNRSTCNRIVNLLLEYKNDFIAEIIEQSNYTLVKKLYLLNHDELSQLLSNNILTILYFSDTESNNLSLHLENISILYALHRTIPNHEVFNQSIEDIISNKINYNKIEKDLIMRSNYQSIMKIISLYDILQSDIKIIELLNDIYSVLSTPSNQTYLVEILQYIMQNSQYACSRYVDVIHNLSFVNTLHDLKIVEDIINMDILITNSILFTKDTLEFFSDDNDTLNEFKNKIVIKIATTRSIIKTNLNIELFRVLLKYTSEYFTDYFDAIFDQFTISMRNKLNSSDQLDIILDNLFEFFVLADYYNKDVIEILKDFIDLFSILKIDKNYEIKTSILISKIGFNLKLFNQFLFYLQKNKVIYEKFILNLKTYLLEHELTSIILSNARTNPMQISILIHSLCSYNKETIADIWDNSLQNYIKDSLEYDLSNFTLLSLYNKDIQTIQNIDILNKYKSVVLKAISDKNISEVESFLYLKGLLYISDNKLFIDNLKKDDIITDYKREYKQSKKFKLTKIQQIICNKIIKDYENLEFYK